MSRERQPSVPGLRGVALPRPDSVPPQERVLRELAGVEGRILARMADLDERLSRVERSSGTSDADVRAMREDMAQIREDMGRLMGALLRAQQVDAEHERNLGEVRAELVKAGQAAGARRGALAGVGTAIVAVGVRWAAQKLGIPIP